MYKRETLCHRVTFGTKPYNPYNHKVFKHGLQIYIFTQRMERYT